MKILREGQVVILPPRAGACRMCGDVHEKWEPHNLYSIVYQHRFRKQNGRYPTWEDAVKHCDDRVKKKWEKKYGKSSMQKLPEAETTLPQRVQGISGIQGADGRGAENETGGE